MLLKHWLFIGSVTVVVSGLASWLMSDRDSPENAELRFVENLERRDWKALYAQAPAGEYAPSLSEPAFSALMAEMAKGVGDQQLRDLRIEASDTQRFDGSRGLHAVMLTFPNAKNAAGLTVQHLTAALRTREGWKIPINWMPTRFAEIRARDRREYWALLGKALAVAGIDGYRSGIGRTTISRHNIERYLAGEIEEKHIYDLHQTTSGR